jgi:TRAP transporter TAXI family solute receptor
MSRFRGLLWASLILVGVATAVVVGRIWLGEKLRQDLVISTGTPGGTYIQLGAQLARILEEYRGEQIGSVEARESHGSVESIERILSGEAHLAFVIGPVLAAHPRRGELRALTSLYTDRVQVVVHRSASIESLGDLARKRVYIGADKSGTKPMATAILSAAGVSEGDYSRVGGTVRSFEDASRALQDGRADAAFFVASTPAKAVSDALASGCCSLLDLGDHQRAIERLVPGLGVQKISGQVYANQPEPVHTVGGRALLIAHEELETEVVLEIEAALFGAIGALAEAHIRAEEIRLERAFAGLPAGIEPHPGALEFLEAEREKLVIATGTINGKYYRVGKQIRFVLRQIGIPARVTQTGGSLENLQMLEKNPRTLAIVQYDTALASYWSPKIYHTACLGDSLDIPRVRGMRSIATLHEEKMHALIRRDRIPVGVREQPTLSVLRGGRVSVGPEKSGTQILVRAILCHYGVDPAETAYLSVPDMGERLRGGEIDAGFFMGHVPSQALRAVVHDGRNRLLSIEPRYLGAMLGPALGVAKIEPGIYGAQLEGEPPIETVSTWAVLVAREDLEDVETITRAVFEGAAFLGISQTTEGMARNLPSLPIHPGARDYYEEAGLLPSWSVDWLTVTWRSLAILVMLAGACRGYLTMRRDATRSGFTRQLLEVPTDADYSSSTADLRAVSREVRERAHWKRWKRGHLDQSRVSELEGLIAQRIEEARRNRRQRVLAELRVLWALPALDEKTLLERYASLEEEIWIDLENGELDSSRHKLLLDVIREKRSEIQSRL